MSVKALDWAFEQDISSGQKFVLVSLADHADARGACFPSVRRLMQRTGFGESTVRAHLAALTKSGHIRVSRRFRDDGGQRSNRVWLPIPGVDLDYDPDEDGDDGPADPPPLIPGGGAKKEKIAPPPDFRPSPPESDATSVQISDPPPPGSGPLTVNRTVIREPSDNREMPAGPNAPASARQVALLGELNERLGGTTTRAMLDVWQEDMTRAEASAEIQEALAVDNLKPRVD